MAATPERHWPQIHPQPRHALLSGPAALDPYHSGLWVNCGLLIDRTLLLLVCSLLSSSVHFYSPPEPVPVCTTVPSFTLSPSLALCIHISTQEGEADSSKWLSRASFSSRVPFLNKQTNY